MFGFFSYVFSTWFFVILFFVCLMNVTSVFHPQNFAGYFTSFFGLVVSIFSIYVFSNKAFGFVLPYLNISLIGTLSCLTMANFILNMLTVRYFASEEDVHRSAVVMSITLVSSIVTILSLL